MSKVRIVRVAIAVSLSSFALACSGTSAVPGADGETSNDPVKPAPSSSSGDKTTTAASSGGQSSGGSSSGMPAEAGTATADASASGANPAQVACFSKCASANPAGFDEFGAILQPCACAPAACGAVCGPSCSGNAAELLATTSAACRTCVNDSLAAGGACNKAELNNCLKKPHCPSFAICAQGCQ